MKKWLFPALLAALLLTAVGCDKDKTPQPELPETVDELTVVTTAEETETTTEPETQPETAEETEEPAETDAPAAETETLSEEEAAALLDEIVQGMVDREDDPIEVNMTAEAKLTAYMFGFSGITTIPLSGYYAVDGDQDVMIAYAVPMEGTGVCIVTDGMLYLHDGADTAVKASLDEQSVDEVKAILLERLMEQIGAGLPSMTLPMAKDSPAEPAMPAVPSFELNFTDLLGQAIAAVPLEDAFIHVTAVRNTETGECSLILSGISDSVLDMMETILTAIPETEPSEEPSKGLSKDVEQEAVAYDKETALALVALLREQADTAVTVTLTVDDARNVVGIDTVTALDLTALPALTANMPVEMEITTHMTLNRENISIEKPEDSELYTEVLLKDLLPTSGETAGETETVTEDTSSGQIAS